MRQGWSWHTTQLEKPFLPLGICWARRSRRQKASVTLQSTLEHYLHMGHAMQGDIR